MTALEFVLKEHQGLFTKEELNTEFVNMPPSVEEICNWMVRFTEYHIVNNTKLEDIE